MTPTVERAAEHAGVSRTTAYRYFPNQRSLLVATYSDGRRRLTARRPTRRSIRRSGWRSSPHAIGERLLDNEPELRAMLRLSLDPANRAELPLRAGRAIGWIEDALAPLRDTLSTRELHRLVLSIRATLGIEPFVWLTDIAGLPRDEAVELMRHSARTLLRAAL